MTSVQFPILNERLALQLTLPRHPGQAYRPVLRCGSPRIQRIQTQPPRLLIPNIRRRTRKLMPRRGSVYVHTQPRSHRHRHTRCRLPHHALQRRGECPKPDNVEQIREGHRPEVEGSIAEDDGGECDATLGVGSGAPGPGDRKPEDENVDQEVGYPWDGVPTSAMRWLHQPNGLHYGLSLVTEEDAHIIGHRGLASQSSS
jgi:hypothetical protein